MKYDFRRTLITIIAISIAAAVATIAYLEYRRQGEKEVYMQVLKESAAKSTTEENIQEYGYGTGGGRPSRTEDREASEKLLK